jgi:hypothetical protein
MRRLIVLLPAAVLALLAACGGGGSNSDFSGSTSSSGGNTIATSGSNVAPITVDSGPAQNSVNTAFVSVTVCTPGSTTNCATIDQIEVDTGSYGLRIFASVLPSNFALPQENDASGNPIVECTVFADGITWGPVANADIHIAGESAANQPVQIIGSSNFTTPPAECSSQGSPEDTVGLFAANGIIGIGPFVQDNGDYYTCPQGVCSQTTLTTNLEVANPVASFATDNNGVIVELPSVGATGADSLSGSLVFGIGTESNNSLGSATVYALDPSDGNLTATYNSTTFGDSVVDSGSNAYYFIDSSIPTCSDGFFCPTSTLSLTATLTGVNSASTSINFTIANVDSLINANPSGVAFDNLGAPNSLSDSFDFGLPFFFGRNVFTAIAGESTPAGAGPYIAF